ncbi:MAG: hypothetical protein ACRD1U_07415 [Vicinamibacterales bacterium]
MDLARMFDESGLFAKFTVFMGVLPFVAGLAYAWRPTESTLALLRPLSLSATFAALGGVAAGWMAVLLGIAASPTPLPGGAYVGMAEAMVPAFVNFGFLAAAWLLVAAGMWRRP